MKSMVLVPGGTFIMGTDSESQKDQPVRSGAEEWPPHNVILKSFYMDKTEVTNAQFKELVGVMFFNDIYIVHIDSIIFNSSYSKIE